VTVVYPIQLKQKGLSYYSYMHIAKQHDDLLKVKHISCLMLSGQ